MQCNTDPDVQRDGLSSTTNHNLKSLGQRRKVFIWFISTKHVQGTMRHPGKLEARIYMFARHLESCGFVVTHDFLGPHTSACEAEWASWIATELSEADWIICVCSQFLYESFSNTNNPTEVAALNAKAKFLKEALYNCFLTDKVIKVIPVILQREDDDLAFVPPTLRDPRNIIRIFEDIPFNVEMLDGDLERLICRMAGIDRMKLTAPAYQGFIELPSKIAQSSFNETTPRQAPGNHYKQAQNATANSNSMHRKQPLQQHYHQQNTYQENTHIQQSTMPPLPYNEVQYTSNKSSNPKSSTGYPMMYNSKPQYKVPYTEPSAVVNSHSVRNQHSLLKNTHPGLKLPTVKIPPNSPILWKFSQEVKEWKFLGRYLDLDEGIIEEIDYYTIPNKTRDKALRVLTEWVNTSAPTWDELGEALLDAEYMLLYEKLLEII